MFPSGPACLNMLALLALLASTAFLSPAAEAQGRRERREHDPGDADSIQREHGLGRISLGATAKGRILQGFFNMISFEAVEGTRVSLALSTRHPEAKLIAELLYPRRAPPTPRIPFQPDPEDASRLVLADHPLATTGVFTVRFAFTNEYNGDYTLESDAVYPATLEQTIKFGPDDSLTFDLAGMSGRRLETLSLETKDGAELEVEIADPYGSLLDLKRHLRTENWGRRVVIFNLVIESNNLYEVRVRRKTGNGGTVQVAAEFKNPRLSRKTTRI